MSNSHPLPPKKEVALALLERSNDRGIFVHLDPRQVGVVVPPWFKKQPQLVLQIGLNMPVAVPDLRLDDEGMSCTLSFNRSPFHCVVPWASVFAMVGEDGKGMVWPDDVPVEVPLSRQGQERPERAGPTPERAPGGPPPIRAVEGARREPKAAAPLREEDGGHAAKVKRPRKRPQLTAVPDGQANGTVAAAKKGKVPRVERPQAAAIRPVVAPAPVAASSKRSAAATASRKKREIPPYLRVVK
jgi:stringent starvation protein B